MQVASIFYIFLLIEIGYVMIDLKSMDQDVHHYTF